MGPWHFIIIFLCIFHENTACLLNNASYTFIFTWCQFRKILFDNLPKPDGTKNINKNENKLIVSGRALTGDHFLCSHVDMTVDTFAHILTWHLTCFASFPKFRSRWLPESRSDNGGESVTSRRDIALLLLRSLFLRRMVGFLLDFFSKYKFISRKCSDSQIFWCSVTQSVTVLGLLIFPILSTWHLIQSSQTMWPPIIPHLCYLYILFSFLHDILILFYAFQLIIIPQS